MDPRFLAHNYHLVNPADFDSLDPHLLQLKKQPFVFHSLLMPSFPTEIPNLNPLERLWKWMEERVIYNTYYEHFEDFRESVLGFFAALSTVTEDSLLGQSLRSRVRDKFQAIHAAGGQVLN